MVQVSTLHMPLLVHAGSRATPCAGKGYLIPMFFNPNPNSLSNAVQVARREHYNARATRDMVAARNARNNLSLLWGVVVCVWLAGAGAVLAQWLGMF